MSKKGTTTPTKASPTVSRKESAPEPSESGLKFNLKVPSFRIPGSKYGVLLTAAALALIYVDGNILVVYLHCWAHYFRLPAFATRLFSVLRFESVIHEFDPYVSSS
jgi:hypothetical protein